MIEVHYFHVFLREPEVTHRQDACVCVCANIYIYTHTHIYYTISTHTHIYIYIHTHIYIYMIHYIYISTYIYIYIHIYTYAQAIICLFHLPGFFFEMPPFTDGQTKGEPHFFPPLLCPHDTSQGCLQVSNLSAFDCEAWWSRSGLKLVSEVFDWCSGMGNGGVGWLIIVSREYYRSFPHSLLSTSKLMGGICAGPGSEQSSSHVRYLRSRADWIASAGGTRFGHRVWQQLKEYRNLTVCQWTMAMFHR